VAVLGVASLPLMAATLSDAVDAPSLVWQSGGDSVWFDQSSITQDGVDAAVSGPITDGQESWLQTTVIGPGSLTFWWKVSCELGYDDLRFLMDGIEQNNISGEVNWEQRSYTVGSGEHVLTWRYVKDPSDSAGLDRGWLDQVTFTPPGQAAPSIVTQPASQSAAAGATVSFSVTASGVPEPTYQWYFNGNAIARGTNRTLTLNNVGTSQAGSYTVLVRNPLGSVTSDPAALTVIFIGDVLEARELPWTVGGDTPWFGQSSVTHDQIDAAESGAITNSQQSWLETEITGPGYVTFWWKVSSEPFYDGLQFITNGTVAGSLSGETVWEQKLFLFPRGLHTLRWRYFKDGSISQGLDKGWLDEVAFSANTPPTNLNLTLKSSAVDENGFVELTGSFSDTDLADPLLSDRHLVTFTWGDGTAQTTTNLAVGITSFSATHQYRDDDPTGTPSDTVTVTVVVSDETGSAAASLPLRILNVPPVLTNVIVSRLTFPFDRVMVTGNISDIGSRDHLRLSVSWGDSTPAETFNYNPGTTSFTLPHIYPVANTNLSITLTLMDDDTGTVTVRTNVVIPPAPLQPRVTSITPLTNGRILLRLQGSPQANYQIQASEDLRTWTTIAIRPAAATGLFEAEDIDRRLWQKRFYRAMWETQSAGIRFGQITRQSNGRFLIRLIGLPATNYRIETSTNAVLWSTLGTVNSGVSGLVEYEDGSAIVRSRFYRASAP